ncbi:MAG: ActR/PrrA/RegA family redox response regulator transcription factor [Inquilinus sp.]|nr:ActR/PrrA/RegA family redox response regulator transcription factor [Inquilinus sp.]
MSDERAKQAELDPGSVLILDDDASMRKWLVRALEQRGFEAVTTGTVDEAIALAKRLAPAYAVLDMKVADGNGLEVIPPLLAARPEVRIVVLTGYGNLASAVAAVKAGAVDYLSKPANADQIVAALLATDCAPLPPPPETPMSADRVRWEHIQRVYEQCGRNVSETARRLKMHRRTLQRILSKYAPKR